MRVDAPADLASALDELVGFIPAPGLEVGSGAARSDAIFHVEVVADLGGCHECYRIDPRDGDATAWTVHASDVLGAQYGVTHVFELLGFRFRHPFDTYVPPSPAPGPEAASALGRVFAPDKTRRGVHLHTVSGCCTHCAFIRSGRRKPSLKARSSIFALASVSGLPI